jgi:hypothetical protein
MEKAYLTTVEFAVQLGVQPKTVRRAHCLQGHYCGIRPVKPNRILLWSAKSLKKVLNEPVEVSGV